MIELYMWSTSSSRRASVGLGEAGLDCIVRPVNLCKKKQRTPKHTARNPYQKVPVVVDSDGPDGRPVTAFESGAILLYAAEKSGRLYGRVASYEAEGFELRDYANIARWIDETGAREGVRRGMAQPKA